MKEIMYAIESMEDIETIKNFIKQLDLNGWCKLTDILRYTNTATESLWLAAYSDLFRGE